MSHYFLLFNRRSVLSASLVAAWMLSAVLSANAAPFYTDQMTSSAGWGVNAINGDDLATFGFDYGAIGIPEAPNTQGGDVATRGVKMEANLVLGQDAGFTIYPIGQNFSGNYKLRFDSWMSYDVDRRINGDAFGTTEFLGGGIGYNNVAADVVSGVQSITTGEGSSGNDWRVYKSAPQFFVDAVDMVAGDRNGSNAYSSDFLPGVAPPAGSGQPAIAGIAGSPGFQWITWEFDVSGDLVDIWIEKPNGDRLLLAQVDGSDLSDGSSGATTSGNISIFYADYFTSISANPEWTFGIVDNVVVDIPEPASIAVLGLASLAMLRRRRLP